MAVVQISRIQVRRGKKNVGTGIPQLASGEFGWAVDERELYIGNGSVSEGAPAVGNTKVLTEFSDILGEAAKYAYKKDELNTGASGDIVRTLQEKLDDIVNVRDFGAAGDGSQQAEALQRAIDTLFLGSDLDRGKRITLYMPAGEYNIDVPLYIPPYTRIVGDGPDATLITGAGAHVFKTVNSDSVVGSPADISTTTFNNQAKNIYLSNMTLLDTTYGGTILLENCRDSVFENIAIQGQFDSSTDSPYVNGNIAEGFIDFTGIKMTAISSGVGSNNNQFKNCKMSNLVHPVYSDYDISNNLWDTGTIDDCWFGFVFGLTTDVSADNPGQFTGPSYNTITNYQFDNVYAEAILVREGVHNTSVDNKYYEVGNAGGGSATATTACIRFGYTSAESSEARYDPRFHVGNKSENDYFKRTEELSVNGAYNTGDYPPEVEGAKNLELNTEIQTRLGTSANNTVAVADISQADPCVVRTFTAHNFQNNQAVQLTGLVGMTELEGRSFFIKIVDDDEFELYLDEGLTSSEDSTTYTAYGSDGVAVGSLRTYFMQLPADQDKGTIIVDYVYNGTLTGNEINRSGSFKVIYDIGEDEIIFTDDQVSTGNTFYADQLDFTAALVASDRKVTFSFVNTGFSLGSDQDNFRFTVKHIV